MTNVSPKYVSCTGRGIFQGHDDKISRPSAGFMIKVGHSGSSKITNFKAPNNTLCQET